MSIDRITPKQKIVLSDFTSKLWNLITQAQKEGLTDEMLESILNTILIWIEIKEK